MNLVSDPEHIAISKSKGIQIDWKDGHHSQYTLAYLRDECPCAGCTGAHGTVPEKTNYSQPDPSAAFPMFKPSLKMNDVEPIGAYAVRIHWSDGHKAGIYSWEICDCAECTKIRNGHLG
ncbi:MAG: DUF971 domain-containing protein [Acidobacteria bacterium]|nr:DUF971 domain-containing protein [Acidobacteriota bacterium]